MCEHVSVLVLGLLLVVNFATFSWRYYGFLQG